MSSKKVIYNDLREWLEIVEKLGELKIVEGANCQEDIGMATELLHNTVGSPAVLFDNITGYQSGYRVLVNALKSKRRLAITTGLQQDLSRMGLSMAIGKKFKESKPLPPKFVDVGPVLENIYKGNDVNVLKFPAPLWHEYDGGH